MKQLIALLSLALFAFLMSSCITAGGAQPAPTIQTSPTHQATRTIQMTPTEQPAEQPSAAMSVPLTASSIADDVFPNPSGNRLAAGKGAMPAIAPLDIALSAQPRWITALPTDSGSEWIVALDNGEVHGFRITAGVMTDEFILPSLPEEAIPTLPLALQSSQGQTELFPPRVDADALAGAVPLPMPDLDAWLYVADNGDLVLWNQAEIGRLPIQALPDTRILVDEQARVLLLAKPTTRYAHGILGDTLEPTAVLLIETTPSLRVITTIEVADEVSDAQVIEGLAPLWVDIDGDGAREIVVTISDANGGAQEVVYDAAGNRLAAGQAIGQGFRWRHHIAVAPFTSTGEGASGELELVEVLTPHIGGIVQFSRLNQGQLEAVAQVHGYTAHQIGSRNLDMAAVGDFDGDGRLELLLPANDYQTLGAIQRTAEGAEVRWAVPIGAALTTNLATVMQSDGTMAVGVGRADNTLRLWLP